MVLLSLKNIYTHPKGTSSGKLASGEGVKMGNRMGHWSEASVGCVSSAFLVTPAESENIWQSNHNYKYLKSKTPSLG